MNRLRLSIAILIALAALVFNVERLDFGRQNVVDLTSWLYPLSAAAVLMIIFVRPLARSTVPKLCLACGAIYAIVKLLLLEQRPVVGGLFTYLSITELALLLAVVWAAHRVAAGIYDFEEAVEQVTHRALGHRFTPLVDATERIDDALRFSRRHDLPLSLLVVEPDTDSMKLTLSRALREAQMSLGRIFARRRVASVISDALRRTDILLEQENPARFIVLCRDTSPEACRTVERHIHEACNQHLGVRVTSGRACFPDDAITFEELLERAAAQLDRSGVTAARPVLAAEPVRRSHGGEVAS
jgi:hypothetical protein